MWLILLLCISFALGLIILIWYIHMRINMKGMAKITGPKPLPILGSTYDLSKGGPTEYLPVLSKFCKENNGLTKLQVGFYTVLLVADCKVHEAILSSNKLIDKAIFYKYMHRWLGMGLLTSTDSRWRKHRKLITPTFHFQILEQFLEVFESNSNVFVNILRRFNGIVDVYPLVTLLTLDIICETAMGTTVNAQTNSESEYVRAVKTMCRILMERSFSIIENFDFTYSFTKNYRDENKSLKILHDYTYSVIKNRREALEKERLFANIGKSAEDDLGIKKRMAFLDLLLQSTVDGRPLTDEEIREEVDTFMFEGHDTTASAITFALYLLANNKEAQEKVFAEQKQIFEGKATAKPSMVDFQQMKYLDLVIKETLRLYPSVPLYGREISEDCDITDEIHLKKGTQVVLYPFEMHRNPKYFPEPEKFVPERFLAENIAGQNPYVHVPFSAGARNCIGQKFAILEMKSTISKIICNFRLRPAIGAPEMILVSETILKSANGVFVDVEPRDNAF